VILTEANDLSRQLGLNPIRTASNLPSLGQFKVVVKRKTQLDIGCSKVRRQLSEGRRLSNSRQTGLI
jgi:hypothetical protein